MGKENEEIELAGPNRGEAWGAAVMDKKRMVRERLRALGQLMKKSVDQGVEEFAGEARLALLYSTFRIRNPVELSMLLKWTVELLVRVENWTDCMRPRKQSKVELEAETIASAQTYLAEFRLVVDAQSTSEDERAVARTMELLDERRVQFNIKVEEENAAFEKEVIEPIVRAATAAMDALTDLVDFVTAPRTA